MDALATIGLAANILQFVEFSTRLISTVNEIRTGSDSQSVNNGHIGKVCKQLLDLSNELKRSSPGSDPELEELCNGCIDTANILLQALQEIKAQGSFKRWRSLRSALKCLWGRSKIEELEKRLSQYRDSMTLYLLLRFRNKFDLEALRMQGRFDSLDAQGRALLDIAMGNRDICKALADQIGEIRSLQDETRSTLVRAHDDLRIAIAGMISWYDNGFKTPDQAIHRMDLLHHTVSLIVDQMEVQKEIITQLRRQQETALDDRGNRALQDQLGTAYTALLTLSILYIVLQAFIVTLQQDQHPNVLNREHQCRRSLPSADVIRLQYEGHFENPTLVGQGHCQIPVR